MEVKVTALTLEQHQAIIECLKIAAQRGRALRLARETCERTAESQAALTVDTPAPTIDQLPAGGAIQ